MAAATVVGKRRERVFGDLRVVLVTLTIANNGDTYNTGLKQCINASADATTTAAIGFTKGTGASAGTLTFASAGAVTFDLQAYGYA